jgi:HlyD family secretion protein
LFRDTTAQDQLLARPAFVRRHRMVLVLAAGIVLAAAFVVPAALRYSGIRATVSAARVTIAKVERGEFVRDFVADGRVVAANSPTLYAPATGLLTLQVKAGDAVRRGQVLAKLESPELVARLAQERASLAALQFEAQRAEMEAKKSASAAQESLAQAQVDHTSAQREYERTRKAYDVGAFSEIQLLRAQDAFEKARFHLEQAQRLVDSLPDQARVEIQGRNALLQRQQVAVSDLTRQVAALEIRSPVDGQVGQLQVADHANVARDGPLLAVVDLSVLELEIQAPESLARDLVTGMVAEVSGNGNRWPGTISGVSPEIVGGQITARVRFSGDTPDGLRQNQHLSVRVLLEKRPDVLTVERGSLVEQGAGYAWRVQDDVAVRVPVRLGAASISRVEILEGLQPGDRVIVSGIEALADAPRVIVGN